MSPMTISAEMMRKFLFCFRCILSLDITLKFSTGSLISLSVSSSVAFKSGFMSSIRSLRFDLILIV